MRDECRIVRNLKAKQGLFFAACERRGLTIAGIAAAIDVPVPTINSYRPQPSREASQMPLSIFVKLAACAEIPTALTSLLIEDSGHQLSTIDATQADWLGMAEKAAAFASKVCQFQSTDGRIDHREDAELRDDLITIVAEGHSFAKRSG